MHRERRKHVVEEVKGVKDVKIVMGVKGVKDVKVVLAVTVGALVSSVASSGVANLQEPRSCAKRVSSVGGLRERDYMTSVARTHSIMVK